MNEQKTMPEWGDIVHRNGTPFVVIGVERKDVFIKVADREGDNLLFECNEFDEYKPRTITINGVEVPEPEREPLSFGQEYWRVWVSGCKAADYHWAGLTYELRWIENGLIHLSKENAEAHINAIIRANKGETG
jgi:hypothetical protein